MALQILIHHLVLPVSFIAWLWVEWPHSLARWMSTGLLVGGYILFIVLVGAWWWIGYPLRVLFPILFGIALAISHRRARAKPLRAAPSWKSRLDTGFRTLMGALFLFMSAGALAGYRLDAEAVELQFPMNEGVYAVGHGGSSTLVNYHVVHRSQRYALDIVRLNALGLRARGLLPRELDRYVIFGDTVRSPCAGRVVYARDSLPDLTPRRFARVDPLELDKIRARALEATTLKAKWIEMSDDAEARMTTLADDRPGIPMLDIVGVDERVAAIVVRDQAQAPR